MGPVLTGSPAFCSSAAESPTFPTSAEAKPCRLNASWALPCRDNCVPGAAFPNLGSGQSSVPADWHGGAGANSVGAVPCLPIDSDVCSVCCLH